MDVTFYLDNEISEMSNSGNLDGGRILVAARTKDCSQTLFLFGTPAEFRRWMAGIEAQLPPEQEKAMPICWAEKG
jgi:hypothetical protein